MSGFRWWLFHRLSELGWWICPEPHKSNLQAVLPQWQELEPKLLRALHQEEKR